MYNFVEFSLQEELNVSRFNPNDAALVNSHSLIAAAQLTVQGEFESVNPLFAQIIGYSSNQLKGKSIFSLIYHEYRDQFEELFLPIGAGQKTELNMHVPMLVEGGASKWMFFSAKYKQCADLSSSSIFVVIHEISELRKREDKDHLTSVAFSHSGDGIVITDANDTIVKVNPAFSKISGYSEEQIIGRKPFLLRSGEHDESFYIRIWKTLELDGLWQGEVCYRHKSGQLFYVWETISAVCDNNGDLLHYVSILADMTEIKQRQQILDDLANFDSLTDLPNRHYLDANLTQATEMAKRRGDKVALLFIDLDKFKPINDQYGHKAGDILLTEIASRLSKSVRQEDTAARIGGDEFVVLMPKITNREIVEGIANRVYQEIIKPVNINEHTQVSVSASIGVSIFPDDLNNLQLNSVKLLLDEDSGILELADHAMYFAKENALPIYFFDQIDPSQTPMKHAPK